MKLHRYKNYAEYLFYQKKGNRDKPDGQWGKRDELQFVSQWLIKNVSPLKSGICHGTKMGYEQKWFMEFTGADVIGTEVGDKAEKTPNTIYWDFHRVKPEWLDNIDFIYSNAFDHSYQPPECLKAWMSCVKKTGCCVLEWSIGHTADYANLIDPFGATLDEYKKLISDCGFKLKDIMKYKSPEQIHEKTFLFIVHS